MTDDLGDRVEHTVVANHEEQYSIWPAHRPLPAGWAEVGKRGTRAECLAYIAEVWTDMRPLSLRQRMDGERDRPERGGPAGRASTDGALDATPRTTP